MGKTKIQYQEMTDFIAGTVNAFFLCTACICILEGILGMIFFPEVKFGYEAFLSPPIFGFFSALFGIVNYSRKELGIGQVIFRKGIHLVLIEGLVFGLNYVNGNVFPAFVVFILALSIAAVFFLVYWLIYLNEKRGAKLFNEELRRFKEGA